MGGATASIGGHIGGYFAGFYYWGAMTTIIFLCKIGSLALKEWSSIVRLSFFGFLAFISAIFLINGVGVYEHNIIQAKANKAKFFVPELGGYLGVEWREYLDLAKRSKGTEVIEEYWGLFSAIRKSFPPWPVDSVIHALGDQRLTAEKFLDTADLIVTTNEDGFPHWISWNISQNYWFYRPLLREWTPFFYSPLTIVWKKSKPNLNAVEVPCSIIDGNSIQVKTSQPGLLEVTVRYDPPINRSLLLLTNNFSFSPVSDGFISLDVNKNYAMIPAYAMVSGINTFKARDYPARFISCGAKLLYGDIVYGKTVLKKFKNNFYLTDENWIDGVSRHWAGFFVPNNKQFVDEYRVGRTVYFADGSSRKIVRIEPSGIYLNIFTDGPLFRADRVGSPDKYKIRD